MKYSKDPLGDRMKDNYENVTRYYLPPRTHTIIRCDGKAFTNYLKQAVRPYDKRVIQSMGSVGKYLCEHIQGAQFAYQQSDEVSILVTDFHSPDAEPWFRGNIQKISSVSASMATAIFNEHMHDYNLQYKKIAMFDSRVFTISDPIEVYNYFLWRGKDASRNSINMLAHHYFSHKSLQGVGTDKLQSMLLEVGVDWDECDESFKRGQLISKCKELKEVTFTHKKTGIEETKLVERNQWEVQPAFIFSSETNNLLNWISQYTFPT